MNHDPANASHVVTPFHKGVSQPPYLIAAIPQALARAVYPRSACPEGHNYSTRSAFFCQATPRAFSPWGGAVLPESDIGVYSVLHQEWFSLDWGCRVGIDALDLEPGICYGKMFTGHIWTCEAAKSGLHTACDHQKGRPESNVNRHLRS